MSLGVFKRVRWAHRVSLLAVSVVLLASACGGPAASNSGSSNTTLSLSTITAEGSQGFGWYGPVWLAVKKGYFSKYGLTVNLHPINTSAADVAASFLGGTDDISTMGTFGLLNLVGQGASIRTIMTIGYGTDYHLVLNKTKAQSLGISATTTGLDALSALKGSGVKLAFASATSDPRLGLAAVLSQHGLTIGKDVQFITAGSQANIVAAFKAGQVDGFGGSAPTIYQVPDDQVVRIPYNDFPEEAGTLYENQVVKTDLIIQHPDTVRAFAKGMVEAWNYMATQPTQAMQDLLPMYGEANINDPTAIMQGFALTLGLLKNSPSTPAVTADGWKKSVAIANLERASLSSPLPQVVPSYSSGADSSFVNAAIDSLGLKLTKGG